jgi:hypothetical protein
MSPILDEGDGEGEPVSPSEEPETPVEPDEVLVCESSSDVELLWDINKLEVLARLRLPEDTDEEVEVELGLELDVSDESDGGGVGVEGEFGSGVGVVGSEGGVVETTTGGLPIEVPVQV